MASRKEERERLRQQRLEAERREAAAGRRRLLVGYVVAGLLTGAVVVGIVVAVIGGGGGEDGGDAGGANSHIDLQTGETFDLEPDEREGTAPPPTQQADLEKAAKAAGCELRLDLRDEGNQHVPEPPQYETQPPNSGNHNATPLADGAYLDTPPLDNAVHSLEHGRVEIEYQPDLAEEDQLLLKGLVDEDPEGTLLFPNPDMPFEVAAVGWTNLIGCDRFDERTIDAIDAFSDTFRGQGPEQVPL